jgi:hypothetical protein
MRLRPKVFNSLFIEGKKTINKSLKVNNLLLSIIKILEILKNNI